MRIFLGMVSIVFLSVVFFTLNHQQQAIASLEQAVKVSDNQMDRCLSMVDEYDKMVGEYDKMSSDLLVEFSRLSNE